MLPPLNDEFELLELRFVEALGLCKQLKARIEAFETNRRAKRTTRVLIEEARLLSILRQAGRRLHFKELCKEINWHPRTIKRYLKSLTMSGSIDHRPDGYGVATGA